jgi:hypothetical protein
MIRGTTFLGAMALVAFAAGAAVADEPIWGMMPDNYMNAFGCFPEIPGDNAQPIGTSFTLPDGPSATVDGAIWMKAPSGVWPSTGSQYQLFDPNGDNWSIRITVHVNTTAGWQIWDDGQPIDVMGTPVNMSSSTGYPGYWARGVSLGLPSNVTIVGEDTVHTADMYLPDGNGNYTIPFSLTFPQAEFYIQAWLDPAQEHNANENSPPGSASSAYATFAQAYAASASGSPGVLVGQTPVFRGDMVDASQGPLWYANELGMYMPALILQKATPLPGDANFDTKVDINDLTRVLTNYNQSTGANGWGLGDFNGDQKVDINDLTIVLTYYNQSNGSSAAGPAAVPEPSALLLAAAGTIGLLACCRRERKGR